MSDQELADGLEAIAAVFLVFVLMVFLGSVAVVSNSFTDFEARRAEPPIEDTPVAGALTGTVYDERYAACQNMMFDVPISEEEE